MTEKCLFKIIFYIRDTISSVYQNTNDSNKKFYRPDFTFYVKYEDGTVVKVGNSEIKPKKASKKLVKLDCVKMLEVAKRQLHLRSKTAQYSEEPFTFGILVHGNHINIMYAILFYLHFSLGESIE